ncbi:PAS-domain containing protein [Caenispirillum bisanense]|uniref:histidine kinase n=1 Tax=Caenispirillum bisanense TaxID=414052 RepID=A0A286GY51_9PROT|nr:PAS-domain containing protein [Caenispirillum bisanense]SOE00438.1 PAS domain-containing protein [Caenispirillum bisanense]
MTLKDDAAAAPTLRPHGLVVSALAAAVAAVLGGGAAAQGFGVPAAVLGGVAAGALGLVVRAGLRAQATARAAVARAEEAERQVADSAVLHRHLVDAVDSISEGFVLFGGDGRLVMCNDRYRRAYPMLADALQPGITFDALLRMAAARGAHDPAEGPLEPWVQRRLERHLDHRAPVDCRLSDGHWYRISEHATRAGGVVKVLMDITALKRHEQELAESSARLQTTLESITQGLAVFDADRRLVAWNSVFPRLMDVAEDALPGRGLVALLGGQSLLPAEDTAGAETCEVDVAGRRLEVLVTPMPLAHGGCVATVTDVTDHRRHEAVLTELAAGVTAGAAGASDFFAALTDSLARALDADGAFIAELADDALLPVAAVRDGRPFVLKPLPLVGALHDAVTRGRCLVVDVLHDAPGVCAAAPAFDAISCRARAVIGGHGRPIGVVAVLSRTRMEPRASAETLLDIFAARAAAELERQRALAALRDSEARYRHLVERAPYGILLTRAGQVRFANAAARALLAPPEGEAVSPLGRPLPDLLGFEPPLTAAGGVEAMVEHTRRGAGAADRHMLIGRYPIDAEGGDADLVVLADITDRRQTELALQQAQKMDAVGQLAGGIAHEFNNMLTAIGGFARMAERAPDDAERVITCLAEIVKASDRAAALTAQLLDFSRRRGSDQAVVLDAVETVGQLKSFLRPVLGETVTLTIEPRVAAVRVEVDPARFTQAVVNLAINGRDAIAETGRGHGTLTIGVDAVELPVDAPLRDRLPSLRGTRFAVVEVTDSGTGIAPDIVDRIFEPFFTTKAQGKGTGLGLPMVYGLATRAGGGLEVDGRPGQGAVFRLYLPAVEAAVAPVAAEIATPVVDLWGTALLAEDEEPVRDYLRLVLEEHGMEVVACADGAEALAVWRAEAEGIDVVVSDMVMPGMGGLDLVRAMREDRPDVSVVLVSGYAAEAEPRVAELGPGVTFLPKPVQPDRLLAAVRQALER